MRGLPAAAIELSLSHRRALRRRRDQLEVARLVHGSRRGAIFRVDPRQPAGAAAVLERLRSMIVGNRLDRIGARSRRIPIRIAIWRRRGGRSSRARSSLRRGARRGRCRCAAGTRRTARRRGNSRPAARRTSPATASAAAVARRAAASARRASARARRAATSTANARIRVNQVIRRVRRVVCLIGPGGRRVIGSRRAAGARIATADRLVISHRCCAIVSAVVSLRNVLARLRSTARASRRTTRTCRSAARASRRALRTRRGARRGTSGRRIDRGRRGVRRGVSRPRCAAAAATAEQAVENITGLALGRRGQQDQCNAARQRQPV